MITLNRILTTDTLPLVSTLKERFKIIRKRFGFTQAEIAKTIDIPRETWATYENADRQKVDGKILSKLEELYNINPDWLLFEQGEMLKKNDPNVVKVDAKKYDELREKYINALEEIRRLEKKLGNKDN